MVLIDSTMLVIVKKQLKQNVIFFFGISEKYSFKGRPLHKANKASTCEGGKIL